MNDRGSTAGAAENAPNAVCTTQPPTWDKGRGKVFATNDGGEIQFTADSNVLESNTASAPNGSSLPPAAYGVSKVSGNLVFSSGVTYRIDNSTISYIQDRNGNRVGISYSTDTFENVDWYLQLPAPNVITDSLGRRTNINYNDVNCNGCLSVSYAATNGAQNHLVKVITGPLSSNYRSDSSSQTISQLFFTAPGQPATTYNPTVASAIVMPDGNQYTFQYNNFGEVARVTLPTDMTPVPAIEYDYQDATGNNGGGYQAQTGGTGVMIYRRLNERREYITGGSGSAFSAKTHYGFSSQNTQTAEVATNYDAGGNILAQSSHTYSGSPDNALNMGAATCNGGTEGMEVARSSGYPSAVQNVLINPQLSGTGCSSQLSSTTVKTTLNTLTSETDYTYDSYGNVTDQKDYDWTPGAAGTLLRDTQSTYICTNQPT